MRIKNKNRFVKLNLIKMQHIKRKLLLLCIICMASTAQSKEKSKTPPPLKQDTITFSKDGKIIGTIPIQFKGETILFRIENEKDEINDAKEKLKDEKLKSILTSKATAIKKNLFEDVIIKTDNVEGFMPKVTDADTVYYLVIKTKDKNGCVKTDTIKLKSTKDNCNNTIYEATVDLTKIYKTKGEFNYQLFKRDPYAAALQTYFKTKMAIWDGFNLKTFNDIDSVGKEIEKAIKNKALEKCEQRENFYQKHQTVIDGATAKIEGLQSMLRQWRANWYFLTLDTFNINPFEFKSATVEGYKQKLKTAELELAKLNFSVECAEMLSKNENLQITEIKDYQAIVDTCTQRHVRIAALEKEIADTKTTIAENDLLISNFLAGDKFIYDGLFYKSDSAFMRHHNAIDKYASMDEVTKKEYMEDYSVKPLIHNTTPNKNVSFKYGVTEIKDEQSALSDQLNPILTGLSKITSTIRPMADSLFQSNMISQNFSKNKDGVKIELCARETKALNQFISSYNIRAKINITLIDTYIKFFNAFSKNFKNSTKPLLITQKANDPKKFEAPARVGYTIVETTKDETGKDKETVVVADSIFYRVNKLYHFFPAAGFAFRITDAYTVKYETANNIVTSAKESKELTTIIVGLKWFPKGINIRETNFALNTPRLSIMVALDVKKPKDNLYLGAGWDMVPGFNVNAGCNFYKYTKYELVSGLLERQQDVYKPAFYVGVTVDPSLFVNALKLFSPSK